MSIATVGDARAEPGGLYAPRFLTGWFAAQHTGVGDPRFDAVSVGILRPNPELRARHDYAVLAALPTPKSASVTYDVGPVLRVVVGRSLKLSDKVEVVFLRGRQVVVADFGNGATLGVSPNGFGLSHGGLFSFKSVF